MPNATHSGVTGSSQNGHRLLLVSAQETVSRTLERILCRCGYAVEVVKTGEAAVEWVHSRSFDAVVSELELPGGICGMTMLRRLRDTGVVTPVVLLAEEETDRVRRTLDGCDESTACLCTDSSPEHLKATLAQLLSPRAH